MQPGNTIIRKCAECSRLIEEYTIASGNTFGAIFWTDGKMDAPMFPDRPLLVECPHCNALLWIKELEKLGEVRPGLNSEEFKGSRSAKAPSAAAYFRLLKHRIPDLQKERYLRLRAWWAANDKRRQTKVKQPLSDDETNNLIALAGLLDERDSSDRLIKAEIMRELGEFDNAARLLAEKFEENLSDEVAIIKDLVQRKYRYVTAMNFH